MALSKTDTATIKNLSIHLRLGNLDSVALGASAFIRSATSDMVANKRRAALAEIGVVVSPVDCPLSSDVTFSQEAA